MGKSGRETRHVKLRRLACSRRHVATLVWRLPGTPSLAIHVAASLLSNDCASFQTCPTLTPSHFAERSVCQEWFGPRSRTMMVPSCRQKQPP